MASTKKHTKYLTDNSDRGSFNSLNPKGDDHMLTTTVIGSRPKPDSLSSRNHDTSGWTVDRHWEFRPEKLKAKHGEAIEWAARQQEAIGVDVVSDEEQRCDNYVYYFCRGLDGFDFDNRAVVDKRSGAWSWNAPRITGSVAQPGFFSLTTFASHRT